MLGILLYPFEKAVIVGQPRMTLLIVTTKYAVDLLMLHRPRFHSDRNRISIYEMQFTLESSLY